MPRHIALIANPYSGGKRAKTDLPMIEAELNRHGLTYDLFLTERHNHAVDLACQLDLTKYDAIVAAGGDGTNYQMLNGLMNCFPDATLPPLGLIPMGSGNSFALDLDMTSIADGINKVIAGETRPVDVCYFTQNEKRHYFVNLMGFGFVTDVAVMADYFKYLGDFSYILGVIGCTAGLKFHHLEMELDGELITGENCFVEFCNSRYTGGKMLMAPAAKIDDGLFDVVILGTITRRGLLATFPKLFKGTHGEHPSARFYQARHAVVKCVPEKQLLPDGELLGTTPMEVGILPQRVRYFR